MQVIKFSVENVLNEAKLDYTSGNATQFLSSFVSTDSKFKLVFKNNRDEDGNSYQETLILDILNNNIVYNTVSYPKLDSNNRYIPGLYKEAVLFGNAKKAVTRVDSTPIRTISFCSC